jgi:hypothetical protein
MAAENTKTSIANLALTFIKQRTIMSFADNSEQARKCILFYDKARRATLRACDWNFATAQGQLVKLGDIDTATSNPTVPADQDVFLGYNFLYAEPANTIRFRKVFTKQRMDAFDPYGDRTLDERRRTHAQAFDQWKLVQSPITKIRAIASNLDCAYYEITTDITDESQFDDMFAEGFAYELAMMLCIPLTADKELFGIIKSERDEYMGEAKRKNGGEGTEHLPKSSSYEDARTY